MINQLIVAIVGTLDGGVALAKDERGNIRLLEVGSQIYLGDTLQTGSGAQLTLVYGDHLTQMIGPNSEFLADNNVVQTTLAAADKDISTETAQVVLATNVHPSTYPLPNVVDESLQAAFTVPYLAPQSLVDSGYPTIGITFGSPKEEPQLWGPREELTLASNIPTPPISGTLAVIKFDDVGGNQVHGVYTPGHIGTASAGGEVTYTITISNNGPSTADGVAINDLVANLTYLTPEGTISYFTNDTWTADPTSGVMITGGLSGSGDIHETANMPAGSSITYTIHTTVFNPPEGDNGTFTFSNTVNVTGPAGFNNASATVTDSFTTVSPIESGTLSLIKSDDHGGNSGNSNPPSPPHIGDAIPGTDITYTFVVSNTHSSTESAVNATVQDLLTSNHKLDPTQISWSAVASPGASITAGGSSGTGDINNTVTIPVDGNITYTIHAHINSNATGQLSNSVDVTGPTDFNSPSVTDLDNLSPNAKLEITKTDNTTDGNAIPGTSITYTITATNDGPSDTINAVVSDNMTSGTFSSWSVLGSDGFTASGTGAVFFSDTLATQLTASGPGNSVTYTVTGNIPSNETGTLADTATASADDAPPVTASDMNPLTPQDLMTISKTDYQTTYVPGSQDTYFITVGNTGPSNATSFVINDTLPIDFGGTITSPNLPLNAVFDGVSSGIATWTISDLAPGQHLILELQGTFDASATLAQTNTASVLSNTFDSGSPPVIATDTDTALLPSADLSISKVDITNQFAYTIGGTEHGTGGGSAFDILYQINLYTGDAAAIGSMGNSSDHVEALDLNPSDGFLYGLVVSPHTDIGLIKVDPTTAATTFIGNASDPTNVANIGNEVAFAFAPAGTLYAVGENGNTGSTLYTVSTTTGDTTTIGSTGVSLDAITVDPLNGELFGVGKSGNDTIEYQLSPTDGHVIQEATLTGLPNNADVNGLDFNAAGVLWGVASKTGEIFTIDPTTGVATDTGKTLANNDQTGSGLEALATFGSTSISPGDTITYGITVSNTSTNAADNVVVNDTLPTQGLDNISSPNLPAGVVFDPVTDSWNVSALAPGASLLLELQGTVPADATGTTYTNTATASAQNAAAVSASATDVLVQHIAASHTLISEQHLVIHG